MFCTDLTILGSTPTSLNARTLKCKRWTCEDCAQTNKRRLIGIALDGEPTTLLTLTTNPRFEPNPELAAHGLMRAWQRLARQLKREYGKDRISYLLIWERTKAGMPHLHILLRAPYIPQRKISAHMAEQIGAPIVDIRKVKSSRMVANYVAKYVAKSPERFPGHNRFSRARTWRDTKTAERNQWTKPEDIQWEVVHLRTDHLAERLSRWFTIDWDGSNFTAVLQPIEQKRGSP